MSGNDTWLLVAAVILVVLAGAFSSVDAALASFSKVRAEELVAEGRSGAKRLEERHKRELRRHRADELKAGLATVAGTYRDALVEGTVHHPEAAAVGVREIHGAIEALERNPNEQLLLQALLLRLPPL